MKKSTNLILAACLAAFTMSCSEPEKKDDVQPTGIEFAGNQEGNKLAISGSTEKDYTFRADTKYLLKGFVYVKAGATLTIEPGTVIFGDKATKGTLIIERGAKIIANGTAQKPIVFTSAMAKGSRAAGDWGGVIILGAAPTNLASDKAKIEGGVGREYGGTNAADNSGSMKYVRIEFGGIAFQPDNEINGLTLGGVGTGTTLDYIQVSYSGDDSFEWFGGTVNAKHLIAYKTVDDMFDTDNGYSGNLQFLVGLSNPTVADASGSNGFESDNDANGSTASPKTSATFSNVSLFGPMATTTSTGYNTNFKRGMHIRRNSSISVYNTVVAGWPTGLLLDDQTNGTTTEANAKNGTLVMKNNVIAGTSSPSKALTVFAGTPAGTTPPILASTFDVTGWYNTAGNNNKVIADNVSAGIGAAAFNQTTAPNFMPSGMLTSGGSTAGLNANFFESVSYIGAFGSTDWTSGWANYDPQNTDY